MALNLTGTLAQVFERIGVDIGNILNRLKTNTDDITQVKNNLINYEQDIINLYQMGLPWTDLDGAVLVSSVFDNKIVYEWRSLSTVPMDAVTFVPVPDITIESIRNSTYNIKTGELTYTGGTLPLGASDAHGNSTEIPGAYVTLKLSDKPSERRFKLNAHRALDANGLPDTSFNYNIIFSTNASPIEAYNNENLQSIKLNLSSTAEGDVFTYNAINKDADGGIVSGVSNVNDNIEFYDDIIYFNSENDTRLVQTSDNVQYMHFIVTKESGTYEIDDINVMKLIKILGEL